MSLTPEQMVQLQLTPQQQQMLLQMGPVLAFPQILSPASPQQAMEMPRRRGEAHEDAHINILCDSNDDRLSAVILSSGEVADVVDTSQRRHKSRTPPGTPRRSQPGRGRSTPTSTLKRMRDMELALHSAGLPVPGDVPHARAPLPIFIEAEQRIIPKV